MNMSMYRASVPVFINSLRRLSAILKKGAAHAKANGIDPSVLVQSRLRPDMFTLAQQVQAASDTAKGAGARLAGRQPPSFPDKEQTFAELVDRVNKTTAYLRTLKPKQIDGSEDRDVILRFPGITLEFTGADYLLGFAMPNFYFHVTTAYAILRYNGVNVGKMDFLGEPPQMRKEKSASKRKRAPKRR